MGQIFVGAHGALGAINTTVRGFDLSVIAIEMANVFREHFQLLSDAAVEDLAYNQARGWDSLGHLGLVARIEEAFGIMMETDDVLEMSSFAKAVEIVEKYRAAG
jgi:acyl carrier protein